MAIEVVGYSERGMMNALFYDLAFAARQDAKTGLQQLQHLLELCQFPADGMQDQWKNILPLIKSARVFIEQSFSGFGDLDALLLLTCGDQNNHAVLIEAKVATAKPRPKTIDDHWKESLRAIQQGEKKHRSSLFVQLARKFRLIDRFLIIDRVPDLAAEGPADLLGDLSLGRNRIVLKAADELQKYRQHCWFVALVPDDLEKVREFFNGTLTPNIHWLRGRKDHTDRLGYLTWREVERLCSPDYQQCHGQGVTEMAAREDEELCDRDRQQCWNHTREGFKWNREQIFGVNAPALALKPAYSEASGGEIH